MPVFLPRERKWTSLAFHSVSRYPLGYKSILETSASCQAAKLTCTRSAQKVADE